MPINDYLLEEEGKPKRPEKILDGLNETDLQDEIDEFFDFEVINLEDIASKLKAQVESKNESEKL
jgi:hypothetical protein